MPYVEIKGGRLHYQVDGPERAPAIVFSNSLGTSLEMWEPQMPALARNFRVVRYDTRGHGLSDATSGPYSIEGLARDVLTLLDAIGVECAHFAASPWAD